MPLNGFAGIEIQESQSEEIQMRTGTRKQSLIVGCNVPQSSVISRLTWSNDGFTDAGPAESHPMINTEMMNTLMKERGHTRQPHSGFYKESA